MALFDIFKQKQVKESNAMFGQTALGNNVLWGSSNRYNSANSQILYVTTGSSTDAGRPVDMSMMSRNSTIMACVGAKARAMAQLPVRIMCDMDDGGYHDAVKSQEVSARDKAKAKQVAYLLNNPNNFQSAYEFFYQYIMWHELSGEVYILWWRKDQESSTQTPLEMYVFDSTLISTTVNVTRYPSYRLSTPAYGFNRDEPLAAHQVMHLVDAAWQGNGGFNKGILAAELIGLDQDIDLYANYVMQNGAKPSGMFVTENVIPDGKYKEIAARLKEAWSSMTGSRNADPSKPGQGMLLDQGMKYQPLDMLTLQDTDCAKLKEQTMKRICGLFGVPPAMIGIADQKYNNTQTMLDEFYKSSMYPLIVNVQQKLKQHLLVGYPNLCVEFDTRAFLRGSPVDQMNFAVAGVDAGIMTANESREYLGMKNIEGGDKLQARKPGDTIPGSSPQDTGGGGGGQTRKMNLGK